MVYTTIRRFIGNKWPGSDRWRHSSGQSHLSYSATANRINRTYIYILFISSGAGRERQNINGNGTAMCIQSADCFIDLLCFLAVSFFSIDAVVAPRCSLLFFSGRFFFLMELSGLMYQSFCKIGLVESVRNRARAHEIRDISRWFKFCGDTKEINC